MKQHPQTRLTKIIGILRRHPHAVAVASLIVAGFATRFFLFGYPNQTVFDEVYFGKFVSAYFTGNYYFDIHPPLAKLVLASFAALAGFQPTSSFSAIGTVFSDNNYLILRFLPSLAGALLPLIVYSLGRELGLKIRTAFFIGLVVVLENALLTQSRFVLIDSILIAAGFASLWSYLVWRRSKKISTLILGAVLAGLAVGTKWIALPFVVLPIIYEMLHLARPLRIIKLMASYALVVGALYLIGFSIHATMLNKSGDGDAFMSRAFQSTLEGNQYANSTEYAPPGLAGKIAEINIEMYAANKRLTAGHPYGSKWYCWPLMIKPISYWVSGSAQIWLFGNPVIWGAVLASIITAIIGLLTRKVIPRHRKSVWFLVIAFLICWLPFALISRVMFLYHYLTPLVFGIIIFGFLVDDIQQRWRLMMLVIFAIAFIAVAPLSYGLTITPLADALRGLPLWR